MNKVYKLQHIAFKLILAHINKKIKNMNYNNYYINMYQKYIIMVKQNNLKVKTKSVRK